MLTISSVPPFPATTRREVHTKRLILPYFQSYSSYVTCSIHRITGFCSSSTFLCGLHLICFSFPYLPVEVLQLPNFFETVYFSIHSIFVRLSYYTLQYKHPLPSYIPACFDSFKVREKCSSVQLEHQILFQHLSYILPRQKRNIYAFSKYY